MKHIFTKALCLVCAGALALSLAACGGKADSAASSTASSSALGSASDYDYQNFNYSDGLDEKGYWEGIRALDYVTLPEDFASVAIKRSDVEPTSEEVEEQISDLLSQYSSTEHITDRAAADGDTVNINYVGSVNNVEFTGGSAENYDLTLGSGTFIDGFEDQIIGHKPGETFDVNVTFPDGYSDSTDASGNAVKLSGQKVVFTVTLNYISESVLPELTDSWVADTFGTFGTPNNIYTVEALRAYYQNQLYTSNLNTAVIGGSGSGKTATHVIPNILKGSMNYACTDPKGELYAKTGGKLEKMGYTVKQLDLVDLTSWTKFNPMRYIDPDKPDVAIMRLVTNIMDNTNGSTPKEHQTDDFWTKSERSLLTALTAFVYYLPDDILKDCLHIDAGQTLNAVADMRDLLEASEQDETKESQVDAVARTATEIYEETRAEWEREDADHDDPDLREAWRLAQGLKFAARQYRPFTQGAGETKKGIIISLGVRLAPLTVGPVREILSDDDLGIDRIGGYQDERKGGYQHPNKKTAIFLALPDEDPTFNFLAAIFYQCLFDSIIRRCRTYPGECLATPLHCFLDEFANVGRIPNFDKLIATIRSRKVSVSIILQTIAQLKTMYKDSWETIVGNCDSVLFLGGNEQSTTEWLSKLLGKETIDICTTSDSKGVSGSHTTNYQRTGRELLTPDELAQLDNDKCIYNLRGLHPFLSRKAWPGTTITKPKSTLKHSEGWRKAA